MSGSASFISILCLTHTTAGGPYRLKCTSSRGDFRMPKPFGLIPVGELARRTGLASSALQYYERVGLVSPAARAGGRRHLERRARGADPILPDFTLREIRALLAAGIRGGRPWARLAQAKLRELDSRIAQAE